MPTGYTYDVVEGKVTEFKDFALECARAFGACITLRDSPEQPIPAKFEPDQFYFTEVKLAQQRITELMGMTAEQAVAAADAAYIEAVSRRAETLERYAQENARLDAMRDKVQAWEPPSEDHWELKSFMLEQLDVSRRDMVAAARWSSVPVREVPEVWLTRQRQEAAAALQRAEESLNQEIKRAAARTLWVQQLRASLEPQPTKETMHG